MHWKPPPERSASRSFLVLLLGGALFLAGIARAEPTAPVQPLIQLDQFGYLPEATKVAVLADPRSGFDSALAYTPGPQIQVRRWKDDAIVHTGSPVAWNDGAVHAQSGNAVWWFDFSPVTAWGSYYLYDPSNGCRSHRFAIGDDVYRDVLRHAVRVFFYQRSGFAKAEPFADARWTDGASHLGPNQDLDCRLVTDPSNASLARDLSGGWYDAGDFNKYVTFTHSTLHDLIFAFRQNPSVWTDDFGIPESGNGIPDLLDEVNWELDWLRKMQTADGSVLSKVSVTDFSAASPPSSDAAPRRYGSASTSATLTVASVFAHAARAFAQAGRPADAADLIERAESAWSWAEANPAVTFSNAGFASVNPEVSAYDRSMLRLCAAVHLYAITGKPAYRSVVDALHSSAQPIQWHYFYPYETPVQDALMEYTTLPGATASVRSTILQRKQTGMDNADYRPAFVNGLDAYRASLGNQDYVWGSNRVKSHKGLIFLSQNLYGLDAPNAAVYRDAAAGFLHYLHGTNALGLVFLTAMDAYGAERSCQEMYHGWFAHGTSYDNALTSVRGPAPGYVTGGVNPNYAPDPSYSGPALAPPQGQPVQKSYRDWNTSWPENSWEISEPAIYYQAAYVRLLSGFVRPVTFARWITGSGLHGSDAQAQADPDGDGTGNLFEFLAGSDPRWPESPRSLAIGASADAPAIRYAVAGGRTGFVLSLETSTTLAPDSWQDVTSQATPSWLAGENRIHFTFVAAPGSLDRRFFRLRAEVE